MNPISGADFVDPHVLAVLGRVLRRLQSSLHHIPIDFVRDSVVPSGQFRGTRCCQVRDDVSAPRVQVFLPRVMQRARQYPALFPAATTWVIVEEVITALMYLVVEDAYPIISQHWYHTDPTVKHFIDARASESAREVLDAHLVTDPRLGAPKQPRGYAGPRVTRYLRALDAYIARAEVNPSIHPCYRRAIQRRWALLRSFSDGGQLTPGDVLDQVGLDRNREADRAWLRQEAKQHGIGISAAYADGRERRLYIFGDVSRIAALLQQRRKPGRPKRQA